MEFVAGAKGDGGFMPFRLSLLGRDSACRSLKISLRRCPVTETLVALVVVALVGYIHDDVCVLVASCRETFRTRVGDLAGSRRQHAPELTEHAPNLSRSDFSTVTGGSGNGRRNAPIL